MNNILIWMLIGLNFLGAFGFGYCFGLYMQWRWMLSNPTGIKQKENDK